MRGGAERFPHELNPHRPFCTPHSAFRTWQALRFQGFGGEGEGGLESAGAFLAQGVEAGG